MLQMSSNGEIIKNISTYPKNNICSHHICSRLHKSCDPLSSLPNFAITACRIDFVYSIYFWFSFYCACTSFNHKLMYLYVLLEMEKGGAPLFLNKSMFPPLDPANPLYHRLILSRYTIYVSGKLGQGGERYSVSQRRCVVRIQFGKIYLNDLENGVKVT